MNETHEPQPVWWVELEWAGDRQMRVLKVYEDKPYTEIISVFCVKITDPLVQDEIGAFNYARRTLTRLGIALG